MKVLDLDMDFFSETPAVDISEDCEERLDEEVYGKGVFSEESVRYIAVIWILKEKSKKRGSEIIFSLQLRIA